VVAVPAAIPRGRGLVGGPEPEASDPASDDDPRLHQTQCHNLGLPYQSDLQDGTLHDPSDETTVQGMQKIRDLNP